MTRVCLFPGPSPYQSGSSFELAVLSIKHRKPGPQPVRTRVFPEYMTVTKKFWGGGSGHGFSLFKWRNRGNKSEEAWLSILEVMWHIVTIVLLKMSLCCNLSIQFLGKSHKKKKIRKVATFKAQNHPLQSYFWQQQQKNENSLNIQK